MVLFQGSVMTTDHIDDDRDVIEERKPRIDVYAEIERAADQAAKSEAGVTIGTKHVEAGGFWKRTADGLQSWGARIKASWGGK
jgi:hypothetical protein